MRIEEGSVAAYRWTCPLCQATGDVVIQVDELADGRDEALEALGWHLYHHRSLDMVVKAAVRIEVA